MTTRSELSSAKRRSREQVLAELKQIIGEQLSIEPEAIKESDHLYNDLNCDSLDVIEIAMECEEQFDIDVADEMLEDIYTVGQVADTVLKLLESRQ